MKLTLLTILLYIALTVFFYLIVCTIGLIWFKWDDIIHSEGFNLIYWLVFGWWPAGLVCADYYEENE